MSDQRKRLWVNWEKHRRSSVLASHFGCDYRELISSGSGRYPTLIVRTLLLLVTERPAVLFVQNPSMVLAVVAVLWKMLTRCVVVVDRHTTFLIGREADKRLSLQVFRALSAFTLRYADITIVTNDHLAKLVLEAGGRPMVLPDKLPDWSDSVGKSLDGKPRRIVVVSSFAADEPIDAVMEAASDLSPMEYRVYVTGRKEKAPPQYVLSPPPCVEFTGFLSDSSYVQLLFDADMVVVLTTADHTMLCGCYESVAAGRALITSKKDVLIGYFSTAFFVDNSSQELREAMTITESELRSLQQAMVVLRSSIDTSWRVAAKELELHIGGGGADVQ